MLSRRLSRMILFLMAAHLGDVTFLDGSIIVGCIVLTIATGLIASEILSLWRPIPLLRKLDKAGLTSRPRNLLRATAVLAWLSAAIGLAATIAIFAVVLCAHLAAAIIQRLIDTMHQSRPSQPVANLKIKKRYDAVWSQLPEIKRRKSRFLYGFDMWATYGSLVLLAGNSIPTIADLALSNTLVVILFSALLLASLTFMVVRSRWRQQSYFNANVADKVEAKLVAELKKHKPEVLLYFTGARSDRYQLEQWLKPVDKLNLKTMIVVREPSNGKKFPACKWPVVVAPTVAKLEKVTNLPSLKVVIYGSNAAKNMHILRNDKLKHVYLNHGDSDKRSSANPYSRIYDVLLVAGPAGKKRYLDIGFDGKKPAIVEIGRPQLDNLAIGKKKANKSKPTILYAPTWEGVANSVNYTSLPELGVGLARQAASKKSHKLIVKLHPNTGRHEESMRIATEEIKAIAAESEWVDLVDKAKDLYKLFAQTDVLVSDVSAVVSDFLRADKPLVMTLPHGIAKKDYLQSFPIGSAASIVPANDAEAAFATAAAVITSDPASKARAKKKAEVHGNQPKGSQHAFNAVLSRLAAGKPAIPAESKPPEAKAKPGRAKTRRTTAGATPNQPGQRVLISLNRLQAGGAERDCLELSKALSDDGYLVTVYAQHGDLCNELDSRVTYLERPSNRRRAAQILRENVHQFDIVNTHDLRSLAILATVPDRPPILAIVHNVGARLHDRAARWLLRNVPDEVIFVSESERTRVFGQSKPVGTVIRPSVGYATGFVKKLSNVKPDVDTILFCGRLSPERGPDLAIKVLPKMPDKTLVIVGDGPMQDRLIKLANSLGVSSRVEMVGAVSDPYPYIAAAGVVLVPSRRDALPRIVREAAALHRPIVAADNEGVREAAADYENIRYCDPSRTDEFAACITDVLSTKITQRSESVETSSWKPILQKFDELQTQNREQTNGENQQVATKILATSTKLISDRYQQQKQRYFDRVDQVIGDETDESGNSPAENDRREQQRQDTGQEEPERPDSGVIDINEDQSPPERGPHNGGLDDKVGRPIQPSTKVAGLVAPSGEFAVSTIGEQVNLGRNGGSGSGQNVKPADQADRHESGDRHQGGDHVLMNSGVSKSPGQRTGDATTIESSRPMLTAHGSRQSPLTKLVEGNTRAGAVAVHPVEFSRDSYPNSEMGTYEPLDRSQGVGPSGQTFEANASDTELLDLAADGLTADSSDDGQPSSIRKPNDGVFATYVGAPIADYLVRSHFAPRKISPNQVTAMSTLCSMAGARLVTSATIGMRLVGAGALGFGFILDCADGQLARLTNTEQNSGMVLDELSDRASELLLLQQLSKASKHTSFGDAAAVLLVTRHLLSRLPQTKIIPFEDLQDSQNVPDPLRPNGSLAIPFGELLMTASQLTIGERLAFTTVASLVSARLGVTTHMLLGVLGVSRDLAARQVRQTETRRAGELVAVTSLTVGGLVAWKQPGRTAFYVVGPYILLAIRRLEPTTWMPFGFLAVDKKR